MEETKKIAEFFQCGYKIFKKGSEPDKLEDAYYKAFEEGKEKGFWPVILVIEETWTAENFIEEYYGDGSSRQMKISYSHDGPVQLGTGGALYQAMELLDKLEPKEATPC